MLPNSGRATLDVCVDTLGGLRVAAKGADTIELCSALALGGLTPTPGLIVAAGQSAVPVHAMIRPRLGDFAYDAAEIALMRDEISVVKEAGLAGVVFGVTTGDTLDVEAMDTLMAAADGLSCTLHRAIDLVADPAGAVEQAIALGFARILTSGGARRAEDGVATLAQMQRAARGRIEIMAGGGVTATNVSQIATATGITAFHGSCSRAEAVPQILVDMGFAAAQTRVTDAETLAAMRRAVDAVTT